MQNLNNKSADIFLTCQESERASFRAHQKLVSPFFQPPAILSQICSAKSAESTSRGGGIFQGRGLTSTQYELLPMLQNLICKASTTHLRTFSGKSNENGIDCKKSGLRCWNPLPSHFFLHPRQGRGDIYPKSDKAKKRSERANSFVAHKNPSRHSMLPLEPVKLFHPTSTRLVSGWIDDPV